MYDSVMYSFSSHFVLENDNSVDSARTAFLIPYNAGIVKYHFIHYFDSVWWHCRILPYLMIQISIRSYKVLHLLIIFNLYQQNFPFFILSPHTRIFIEYTHLQYGTCKWYLESYPILQGLKDTEVDEELYLLFLLLPVFFKSWVIFGYYFFIFPEALEL